MYFFIIIAVVAIDQILKTIVKAGLDLNESIPVFGDFLTITLHMNTGAAFSIMQGFRAILIIIPAIFILLIIAYITKKRKSGNRLLLFSLSLIAGGGIGNLIDRILFGRVTDFVSVGTFPVFNFADSCVVVGCILVVFYLLFIDRKTGKKTLSGD